MANIDLVALTKTYIADHTARSVRGSLERLAICDDLHGTYSIITIGWDGPKRIVGVTLLATIDGDRIAIHHDGTPGFAEYLIDQGISEDSITLTFHAPERIAA
jgi:hypothetical protein